MLVDDYEAEHDDPLMLLICGDVPSRRLRKGIYLIGHFGSSHFLRNRFEHYYTGLPIGSYGVCDSVEQLLEKCPQLEADTEEEFLVTFTSIKRSHEPPHGGWRWHKWGEYIGDHDPQYEYLYDEPDIDEVLVYSIYHKIA